MEENRHIFICNFVIILIIVGYLFRTDTFNVVNFNRMMEETLIHMLAVN